YGQPQQIVYVQGQQPLYAQQPQAYYGQPAAYGQPAPSYPPQRPPQQQYQQPQQPQPKYYEVPPANPPRIVEKPKYEDLWATLLFVVFLVAFVVLAYLGAPNALKDASVDNIGIKPKDLARLILSAVAAGIVLSVVWFFLMLKFAGTMIHISYFFSIGIMAVATIYFFYIRAIIPGVIWAIFTVLFLITYWYIRHKIPFAKVILKAVTRIAGRFNGTIVAAFIGLIVAIAFNVIWVATAIGGYRWTQDKGLSSGAAIAIGVFLLLVLYWFNEVTRNVVHVTVAGTFATYYFTGVQEPGSNQVTVPVKNVTAKSAGRALTTSLGPVCFGSLLIAIIQTMKVLANIAKNQAAEDGNLLVCLLAACCQCILACIEDLLDYFNKYAYTQVAIYGKGYCQAAKDTWAMIVDRGFEAIINDNLIGNVLGMGSFATGMVCAFIGFLNVKFGGDAIAQDTGHYVA
ncbi:putative choline transporter, neither null mutation nor overexpression affects choline transport, partial [Blyttiomyces sp. JEL0837]